MTPDRASIETAIAALESQRGALGESVVETAIAPLRASLDALGATSPQAPKLKQATILFVDVVGSTAMGTKLEPEDIHDLMDQVLRRFTLLIERHRGRVLTYTGDGMLAVFGADAAREDDAESAVIAGLAIVEEAQQLAGETSTPPRSLPSAWRSKQSAGRPCRSQWWVPGSPTCK